MSVLHDAFSVFATFYTVAAVCKIELVCELGLNIDVSLGQLDIPGRLVRHLCSKRKVNIIITLK